MSRPVTCQAPGKLLIAGEYAGLTPGQPAVVAAVDRYVTVTAAPAWHADIELVTDLASLPLLLHRDGRGYLPDTTLAPSPPHTHLLAALTAVDELRTALGAPALPVRLQVRSALHEQGVKIGLGSSGAVTVAMIQALDAFYRLGLSPEMRLRLALLATAAADPYASGADVAASTWGGWIRYTSPDRSSLHGMRLRQGITATLHAHWPGLSVTPVPPPAALHVGWTGCPASTTTRVQRLQETAWWNSEAHSRFRTRSARVIDTLTHALHNDAGTTAFRSIDAARGLLADLDQQTAAGIFTPALTALCDAARHLGGAGKPSGAGGGDCGIALLPASGDCDALHRAWTLAGIRPVALGAAPPQQSVAEVPSIGPHPRTAPPTSAEPGLRRTPMTTTRKDDHVRLAVAQHTSSHSAPSAGDGPHSPRTSPFDDVRFTHHALAGIDRAQVDLTTHVAGNTWQAPLYINAMTGGSTTTGEINRGLAIAARETGLAIATGSMSPYLKDPTTAGTFTTVRVHHPHGFVMANLNPNATPEQACRAIDLIQADALQIHLNTVQETVMPEGDRSFGHWAAAIEAITAAVDVPVIVKEVGFGLSGRTITRLAELGVAVADVAGSGGTDFARIENGRREHGDYAYLHGWGLSTPAALLDGRDRELPLLASGGVRHPLDIARALALGARAVGVSGVFLTTLVTDGPDALIRQIRNWLDQLTSLMTLLGAPTPADLAACDLQITGTLRASLDPHPAPEDKHR